MESTIENRFFDQPGYMYGILILMLVAVIALGGCTESPYEAYVACSQTVTAASDRAQISCHKQAAIELPKEFSMTEEEWLAEIKRPMADELLLVRQRVDGDTATLRLTGKNWNVEDGGISAVLVRESGRWLVDHMIVNAFIGNTSNPEAEASLALKNPYKFESDIVRIETSHYNNTSFVYAFTDGFNEIGVTIQTDDAPLTVGEWEYSYRREAFTKPPFILTITDDSGGNFSLYHGGKLIVTEEKRGMLSGNFDLWAENNEAQHIQVSGIFANVRQPGSE